MRCLFSPYWAVLRAIYQFLSWGRSLYRFGQVMYQCQEGKPRAIEIHYYLLPSVRQTRTIEVFFVSKSLRWTSSQGPEEPKNSLVDPKF
jgi:hypothetical protein